MDRQEIAVWETDLNTYSSKKLPQLSPDTEGHLEELLAREISLLESGLLLIGRQLGTPSGRLDLLCVEQSGCIVVVELKRDRIPREAVAQAVDYASQISAMDVDEFKEFVENGVKRGKEGYPQFDDLFDFIQGWEPEFDVSSLNENQRIVLAGCRLDNQIEKMTSWLSANGVEINAYEFPFFRIDEKTILARRIVISPERVESERAEIARKRAAPLTVEQLLEKAAGIGQQEQIILWRKTLQSIEIREYGSFWEETTRSTFSFKLNWDRGGERDTTHKDTFLVIMSNEPYVYLYRDRCEKLMNKSLSELDRKFGVIEKSTPNYLYLRQGEDADETGVIVDELQAFFK